MDGGKQTALLKGAGNRDVLTGWSFEMRKYMCERRPVREEVDPANFFSLSLAKRLRAWRIEMLKRSL